MKRALAFCVVAVICGVTAYFLLRPNNNNATASGRTPETQPVSSLQPTASQAHLLRDFQIHREHAREIGKMDSDGIGVSGAASQSVAKPDTHDDWEKYARERWSIISNAYESPYRIVAADLYRHPEINPRDVKLSESQRSVMRTYCDLAIKDLTVMQGLLIAIRTDETTRLMKLGMLRPLEYTRDVTIVAEMDAIRKEHPEEEPLFTSAKYYQQSASLLWFSRHDGRNYGVSINDLPQYRSAVGAFAEAAKEFYVAITYLAHANGTLTIEERNQCAAFATEWLSRNQSVYR